MPTHTLCHCAHAVALFTTLGHSYQPMLLAFVRLRMPPTHTHTHTHAKAMNAAEAPVAPKKAHHLKPVKQLVVKAKKTIVETVQS